ncbi:uncharacterized protein LOC142355796, partial [Convolutriloba macropyga]|uniref:uncharacterized protein LOC142355796 n=1 Tax=Convolutriloba macropyga TaxID=536237 RepID=UPI003F51B5BD
MKLWSCAAIIFMLSHLRKTVSICDYKLRKHPKSSPFPEINPKDPSHSYNPELDITTFYYEASRDLNPSEYFFISDNNCDYLESGTNTDYKLYEDYIDQLMCVRGRKIMPIVGSKRDFETYVKGNYTAGSYTMAFSVIPEVNYTRRAILGPNCWCKN